MFGKYNKTRRTVREGVNTEGMEYKPIKDFIGQRLVVDGFFFSNKGKYGKTLVVVANGYLINFPKRAVEVFESIAENPEELEAVLNGHLAVDGLRLIETSSGQTTAFELIDID